MSQPPQVHRLDHIVLTVRDVEATCSFYERVLGLEFFSFAGGRRALQVGDHKINLHQSGAEFVPHAARPSPGAGDFCLTTTTSLEDVMEHLAAQRVVIEHGPVAKSGARRPLRSVYFRDPDGNLVEVANEIVEEGIADAR